MTKIYPLLDRLKTTFDADSGLKLKCIKSGKNQLAAGKGNRVFDDFPIMLEGDLFSKLLLKYQELLKHSNRIDVQKFEMSIIKIACDELLDENGKPCQQLIDLLEWSEFPDKINNYLVISAFVGMINLALSAQSLEYVDQYQYTYLAFTKLVNENYGQWIRDYMRQNKIEYDPKYNTDQIKVSDVLLYPVRHPVFTLSVFFGGMFGAGAYGAAKLIEKEIKDHAPLSLPEMPSL